MSLLSTIAHEGAPSARRPSGTAMVVTTMLALVLAAAGMRIFNGMAHEASDAIPASYAGLTGEEFVRLNTTALPEVVGSVVSASAGLAGTEFLRWNTADLPKVVGSGAPAFRLTGEEFVRLNTTALPEVVGSVVSTATGFSGEEFVRLNTTAFPEVLASEQAEQESGPR